MKLKFKLIEKSGDIELANQLEKKGYSWLES